MNEPVINAPLRNVTYGFVGHDIFDWPMVSNLRKRIPRESRIIIHETDEAHQNRSLNEARHRDGVAMTPSPKAVAECADIVITCLPDNKYDEAVFLHQQVGLLVAQTSRPVLFIDCSIIDTTTSNKISHLVTKAGHRFCDAPFSFGQPGSVAGTLNFMIGGPRKVFEEARPLAEAMGNNGSVWHCGEKPGSGLAMKQISTYLAFVTLLGTAEVFNIGRLYGLDSNTLASVINSSTRPRYSSSAQSPLRGVTPRPTEDDEFNAVFSIEQCKDIVEMAFALGHDLGAKSVLKETVLKTLEAASHDPRVKGRDYRSIYLHIANVQQPEKPP